MYSVVLMAAITSGAEVPDFGRRGCGGCYGCYGGYACCGCYGGYARYGGWGCYGCYGGGWGCYGGGYAGWGCYGGCYGGYGGWGCYGGWASVSPYHPTATYTSVPTYVPGTAVVSGSSPATLVVTLPADAKLTVDGSPTQATSSRRVFTTPALEPGKTYYYTVRAEAMRDGHMVETTQRVTVQAGQESAISLELPTAAVASRE